MSYSPGALARADHRRMRTASEGPFANRAASPSWQMAEWRAATGRQYPGEPVAIAVSAELAGRAITVRADHDGKAQLRGNAAKAFAAFLGEKVKRPGPVRLGAPTAPAGRYVIESRGRSRVVDPKTGDVLTFPTRPAARAHANAIKPQMPSSDLPLRVRELPAARSSGQPVDLAGATVYQLNDRRRAAKGPRATGANTGPATEVHTMSTTTTTTPDATTPDAPREPVALLEPGKPAAKAPRKRAAKAAAAKPKPKAAKPKAAKAAPAAAPKLTHAVGDALVDHGDLPGKPDTTEGILAALTPEQRERALSAPKVKGGMRGKGLAAWILTGTAPTAPRGKKATAPAATGPKAGGSKAAAITVLRDAEGPLKPKAITEQILARNLAPGLGGKTPEQTISAMVQLEARKPGGLFVKTEPGTFDLRELNPRGAKKRPAPKAPAAAPKAA